METIDAFFDPMTNEQKQAVRAVTMDMWEAYINRVKHFCSQAKIVFDLFHVIKAFGDVIDEVRRDEVRQAETDEDNTYLKGSRYLLLKNRENLRPNQRVQLRELLAANERLAAVYQLKDQLKMIYRYKRPHAAKRALDQWCAMAGEVNPPSHGSIRRTSSVL